MTFLKQWVDAAYTSVGFFWMALWAFVLGYVISSMIQVFVTEKRMQKTMGVNESKSVLLGTFFGFISSSCSFAALASTKSLFKKGASFVSSVAFMIASTNLVIELGIIIFIFLGWQFFVGEYVGGIIVILISWALIRLIKPKKMVAKARKKLEEEDEDSMEMGDSKDWKKEIVKETSWAKVAKKYKMEWGMVWKDVTLGFTVAGIIAVFVPNSFFQTLFVNSGPGVSDYSFWEILEHVVVGPVAAFITFIGSMGNIPLAALLFGKGVSFAGVMAFIFSDLVVFPVLRINAKYYGWKMSLFMLLLLFLSLVGATLILQYIFDWFHILPDPSRVRIESSNYFQWNYTTFLNIGFLIITGYLVYIGFIKHKDVKQGMGAMASKSQRFEKILKLLAFACYIWLLGGWIIKFLIL